MTNYWQGRRVLVTGASGFVGSHVTELLVQRGAEVMATTSLSSNHEAEPVNLQCVKPKISIVAADLTRFEDCLKACQNQEVVINAAHVDGSVAFKQARPALIFRQNMLMTLNMLEAAHQCGADRFLVMSSTEVYAPEIATPATEDNGFTGWPARLTEGYAWSKRMSEFAAETFARERGLKVAIARPDNVYGPRDSFDDRRGRVIPMFIKKVYQDEGPITLWGTGEQTRSFLYVKDLADGLITLIEKHPQCDPINFGGQEEITIRALAEWIVRLSGKEVQVVCDPTKPSGPAKRKADTTKARQLLDFSGLTPLQIGLRCTINDYLERFWGGSESVVAW